MLYAKKSLENALEELTGLRNAITRERTEHDRLVASLEAEIERLREAVLAAYRKGHHHTVNGGYQWCDQGGREVVEEIIREAGEE